MVDNETLEYYIQSIEELIEDENKVLTYSLLAINLSISANLAKHLLELYRKKHENENLQVTFCLSGIQKDTNSIIIDVVKHELISEWMKNVSSLISTHVYSICKGTKNNVDVKSLCLAESFHDYSSQKSIITSDNINKISDEALLNLREMAYKKMSGCVPKHSAVVKHNLGKSRDNAITNDACEDKSKDSSPHIKKCENQHPNKIIQNKNTGQFESKQQANICIDKKKSITSMFAAQGNQKSNKIIGNSNGKMSNQKPKGIQGFFQKSSKEAGDKVHNLKVQEQKSGENETDHIEQEIKLEHVKNVEVKVMDSIKKTNVQSSTSKPTEVLKTDLSSKSTEANKASIRKNKKSTVIKKRKRVICMSDSDSDNELDVKLELSKDPFEDDNTLEEHVSSEDEIIPPTPQIKTKGVVILNNNTVNPRKKRKIIDKTYTDEDGYILTKKEIVYESCSDNEETTDSSNVPANNSIKPKKIDTLENKSVDGNVRKPKTNKTATLQVRNKQATLTNFFKKT